MLNLYFVLQEQDAGILKVRVVKMPFQLHVLALSMCIFHLVDLSK